MTFILRQSSSVNFYMGPFVDPAAQTTEEALTIDATEVWLSKNGGAYANKNEATAMVHSQTGMYLLKLDATDTNTVGTLSVLVDDTADAATPIAGEYQVVETATYDALYANAATGFNSSGQVALLTATQASIDAAETAVVTTIPGTITTMDALIDGLVTQLDTALTEPAQGNLDHTAKLAAKVSMILKILGNKRLQTATLQSILNSDEATVDHKSIISSDGTTMTFGELKTGP